MAMTITEKILAKASGQDFVKPGDNIWAKTDILLTHDVCGPGTIGVFKREFGQDAKVFDKEKVVIIPDHYIYTEDKMASRNVNILRDFVKEQNIKYFYNPSSDTYAGVCHVALPQFGHVRPGEVIFGTDSHTCSHGALGAFSTGIGNTDAGFIMGTGKLLIKVPASMKFTFNGELPNYCMAKDIILRIIGDIGVAGATYRTLEFAGSAIAKLPIEERMTICNMAIEAGGKNGIIAADEVTLKYVNERSLIKDFISYKSDEDANYYSQQTYSANELEPVVALPHSPDNMAKAKDCSHWKLDRAYIGSCTGGKITDFIRAAEILNGNKVSIDTFLVPATREVEKGLSTEEVGGKKLIEIFKEAGCIPPAQPSCAACLGGPVDTFGRINKSEVCISTTNRNFIGRMGSKKGKVILASPITAAASAITGHITDPREFI